MNNEITIETRRQCVWTAIERCEQAEARWRETEADPRSNSLDRLLARAAFKRAEDEFGWQWRNVRSLLGDRQAYEPLVVYFRRRFPLEFFQMQLPSPESHSTGGNQ